MRLVAGIRLSYMLMRMLIHICVFVKEVASKLAHFAIAVLRPALNE